MNDLTLPRAHTKLDDLVLLTKVRLNALVVATTAGGYYMAAPRSFEPASFAVTCLGTALVASGAAAINQVQERDLDRLMNRTKERPVAGGRMSPAEGLTIAGVLSVTGLLMLVLVSTLGAAALALVTLLTYVLAYTPLKRRTSLATVVGAIPGALPPLIGWVGAGGSLSMPAPWSLFLLMFIWQLPHFLAIAWLYREDYARAGMPMLPVVDPQGTLTGRQAALWAATLVPVTELPFLLGMAGPVYGIAAMVLGIGLVVLAVRFMLTRSTESARWLFFGSIIYLPTLWIVMGLARAI
ncbi:MAG TPA: heme o synthase [Vicinamibacterales bacterium]|nr:heme o synthase [Vicinamibacterales bacterium]